MHNLEIVESVFQFLPISRLQESPHNPRKRFRGLDDLADSIRRQGVITPLVARPQNGDFEIAAGHRRARAAKMAGLDEVPVIVRQMTDGQFMEVLTVENLQREDVHAYEEAQGYRELLRLPGYDVTALAAKIGRSESYVRSRLKLLDLVPEVAEAFLEDMITFAHARLIAPLSPEKQSEALEACFVEFGRNLEKKELVPVSELRDWIQSEQGEDLSDATFPLDDAELVPGAGACITCSKSTCTAGKLFGDAAADETCYDRKCFEAKTEAYVQQKAKAGLVAISTSWDGKKDPAGVLRREEYTEIEIREADKPAGLDPDAEGEDDEDYLEPGEKPCEFMEDAVVAAGHNRGATVKICRNPKCPVHGEEPEESPSGPTGSSSRQMDHGAKATREAEQKKREAEWQRRAESYQRIFSIWAPIIDPNFAYLYIMANLNEYIELDVLQEFAKYFGIKVEDKEQQQKAAIAVWAEKVAAQYLRTACIFFLLKDQIKRYEHQTSYDLLTLAEDRLKEELADPRAASVAKAREKQEKMGKPNPAAKKRGAR